MTRDDVIRMAREAGLSASTSYVQGKLERFAALVVAATRAEILREGEAADWGAAYDAFKAGNALPNDAPALQYAFVAGMHFEREACATACDAQDSGRRLSTDFKAQACADAVRARSAT